MKKLVTTISLGQKESDLLEQLAREKSLSKSNLIGHAIRVLATLEERARGGSKLFIEDSEKNKAELMML